MAEVTKIMLTMAKYVVIAAAAYIVIMLSIWGTITYMEVRRERRITKAMKEVLKIEELERINEATN